MTPGQGAGGGGGVEQIFACDIADHCLEWAKRHLEAQYILKDMLQRRYTADSLTAITYPGGNAVRIDRATADLDMYICGFPCTPFSTRGKRLQWDDDNAQPFFSAAMTVSALRPRVAVFENVPGLKHKGALEKALSTLTVVKGYRVVVLDEVSNHQFGVPQHRLRLYIVMLRQDALVSKASNVGDLKRELQAIMSTAFVRQPTTFVDWLAQQGLPVTPRLSSAAMQACSCHTQTLCRTHACRCVECSRHGVSALKCSWRALHRRVEAEKNTKAKTRSYLGLWRRVKGNPALRKAPRYIRLAKLKGLDVDGALTSPRERQCLHILSGMQNLLSRNSVLDLTQSLTHQTWRDDGLAPPLATGCGKIYLPAFARCLSPAQCLALQGMRPAEYDLEAFSAGDLCRLAGNAMCVQVVGCVAGAALGLLSLN